MKPAVAGALALSFLSAPALAEQCPAERAIYALQGEEGTFRGQFIPALHHASAASDTYFRLTTPQRSYWFSFAVSNGYGGITLIPIADPYADEAREDGPRSLLREPEDELDETARRELLSSLRFIVLDDDFGEAPGPPSSGDAAPPYLMLPEIGVTLWYAPRALSEDRTAERDPMPRGLFRLAECLNQAPPKAWP